MTLSLGTCLKAARLGNKLTLRQVQNSTNISNAYLSQLENDKIKKPSANFLYKLSVLYGCNLSVFLKAAGIIEEITEEEKEDLFVNQLAFYCKQLTLKQKEEVINFIKFLLFQSKV